MNGPPPERSPELATPPGQEPQAETKTCPTCGFVQEQRTRVCPTCEYPWPDAADDPDGSKAQLTQFQERLAAESSLPWLTYGIIGINFAVYLGMLLAGIHFMTPDIASLLGWGANLGSLTTSGQWWRLFTCMFLHIGLIHILFNMFVLWDIGRFLEGLLGRTGFATVYVLAGLCGSVASMWWDPYIVSAGASGAIFGLYGCLIGYLLAGSRDIPAGAAKHLQRNALMFLGYNLLWGLTHRGLDMAGHLGGLLGGLVIGYSMAKCLNAAGRQARTRINLQVLLAGFAIVSMAAAARPRTADLQQELTRFSETETRVQASYNQALQQAKSGTLKDLDFAQRIDTEVIAPWHSARLRLEGIHGLPEQQAKALAKITRYAGTREEAWGLLAEALRQQDLPGVQRATALQAEADEQLKDLWK